MKKSRNLRRSKIAATEDDGKELEVAATNQNIEESVAPEQVKMAQKQRLKQRKAEKKLSVLSFDEDVPDQPPPRIKPLRIPIPPPALHEVKAPSHTQMSAAGEYTAERIAELQQASKQLPKYAQVEVETSKAEGMPIQEEGNDDDLSNIDEDSVLMAKALRQRQKEKTHEPMMSLDRDANSGKIACFAIIIGVMFF
jgi:hypothetical protein